MNNSKKARIRHDNIRDMLLKKDVISIHEFCYKLHASQATIRNDLAFLEKQGMLKRVIGGAISNEGTPRNTSYQLRTSLNSEAKEEIAAYVVKHFIKPDMTISLDAGTTCQFIAKEIINQNIPCRIITYSYAAAIILAKDPNIQLYLAAGCLDHEHKSFHDENTLLTIQSMRSDLFLLSPNGVDPVGGITSSSTQEHLMKLAMISNADKTIITADSSKFNQKAMKVLCPFKKVECIITDRNNNMINTEEYPIPIQFAPE